MKKYMSYFLCWTIKDRRMSKIGEVHLGEFVSNLLLVIVSDLSVCRSKTHQSTKTTANRLEHYIRTPMGKNVRVYAICTIFFVMNNIFYRIGRYTSNPFLQIYFVLAKKIYFNYTTFCQKYMSYIAHMFWI